MLQETVLKLVALYDTLAADQERWQQAVTRVMSVIDAEIERARNGQGDEEENK
jgi:hypothetical protein